MSVADELHQYTVHIGGEGKFSIHIPESFFFFGEGVVVVVPSGLWGFVLVHRSFLKNPMGYIERKRRCAHRETH